MDETLHAAVNDPERIRALHTAARLLRTRAGAFDRLARLAARLLNVPFASVVLVDADRQMLCGAAGLPDPLATTREVPLASSAAVHMVATREPMLVPDVREDERLHDNAVLRELGVMAYAGVPLMMMGQVIGGLSVLDTSPRGWTDDEAAVLTDLAAAALTEVELAAAVHKAETDAEHAAAAERELRQVVESLNAVVWEMDPAEWRFTYVSGRAEEMLGYPVQRWLSEPRFWQDRLLHPEDREWVLASLERNRSREYEVEYRMVRSDGRVRWIRERGFPMRDERGEVYRTVGLADDVTEARESRAELESAHARLNQILATSPTVLYSLRLLPGGSAVSQWVSGNVARTLGYTPEEALRPGWWAAGLHPDDREGAFSFAALLEKGSASKEYRFRRGDGAYRWVLDEMRVLEAEEDGSREIVGSWSDITEQRRAAAALRESEASYRSLFESLTELVCIQDLDGVIVSVNDALLKRYGFAQRDVVGAGCEALFDRSRHDPAVLRQHVERALAGEPQRLEIWGRTRTGETFPQEVAFTRGHYFGADVVIGVGRDVSEKRRIEEQLRQSQKMEAIGRLAGGIAHDFNNVLTVIGGSAQMVLADVAGMGQTEEDVHEIVRATQRAADLTRQMLAFSRKQVLQPRVLDLNESVRHVEKMLRRLIGEDVALETRLSPDLNPVRGDAGQIEQVLMNLAVNARDAMPGGGTLSIATRNASLNGAQGGAYALPLEPGEYVVLSVRDTGVGMDADTRSHLFEPFFTTKPAGSGTGLGLATVYGIVTQSGGHVSVDTAPGAGTTFEVYLPRVQGEREEQAASPAPQRPAQDAACGAVVLVVEDDAGVRGLNRRVLEKLGCTVLEAADGEEALRVAERHDGRIDLLITDVVMPQMSGPELARRLSDIRPGLAVIYTSGYMDDAILRRGVPDAGGDLLQKPFSAQALADKVQEVLARRSPRGSGA
jgi:two-component system cell cycle sensor histidine kinase/response regulator CckA